MANKEVKQDVQNDRDYTDQSISWWLGEPPHRHVHPVQINSICAATSILYHTCALVHHVEKLVIGTKIVACGGRVSNWQATCSGHTVVDSGRWQKR